MNSLQKNEYIQSFFTEFVLHNRRKRYLLLMNIKNGMNTIIDALDHKLLLEIDMRFAYQFKSTSNDLYKRLKDLGAPDNCYTISANSLINDQFIDLRKCIDQTFGNCMGTLIFCVPGILAYYESDEENERYILYKKVR